MKNTQERWSWRTLIRYAGTLAAIILMVSLLRQRWSEIVTSFTQLEWWRLLLAFGFVLLSRVAVIARWHVLLKSAGLGTDWVKTTRISYAGLFATNFLPTTIGGDVVRLAGAVQAGFDAAVAAASLAVDRLVGMAGMAMVLPLGVVRVLGLASFSYMPMFAASLSGLWDRFVGIGMRMLSALKLWRKQPRALLASLSLYIFSYGWFFWLPDRAVGWHG